MSSIAEYRALLEKAESFAIKVEPYGLITLRVPSPHQRSMSYAGAIDALGKSGIASSIASRRALTAQAISSWSVSAGDLLGGKVKLEDADAAGQPLPCSQEAAELLFDVSPQAYQQISDALFDEIKRRDDVAKEAEKN